MLKSLIVIFSVCFFASCVKQKSNAATKDDVIVRNYSGAVPDSHGIIESTALETEPYLEAVMFASKWWPGGGNRLYPRYSKNGDLNEGFTGGVMLLLKHKDNDYSCYLAGANNDMFSWLSTDDGSGFKVNTGHLGKGTYTGQNKIRYVKSHSHTVYGAIRKAWDLHLNNENNTATVQKREDKPYPEYFNYLGWCSWEGFHRSITESNLMKTVTAFENGDVPIRYLLMDAGHMQIHPGPFEYNTLERFKPIPDEFPTNYKNLLDMRKDDKVKWMGIWLAFLGGRDGIHPNNEMPEAVQHVLAKTHMNTLVPNGSKPAADTYFDHYINSYVAEPGWDFTKIDFHSRALTHYAGGTKANIPVENNKGAFDNPYEAATNMVLAMESSLKENDLGLINCNSLNPFSIFNNSNSSVARCSEDYKLYDLGRARSHLYHSYATMPLLGGILWGDHDMFHSSDTVSGTMMAISKAMSGGPIYLSDKPEHFDMQTISPLCYADGQLLRPLAPAVPTSESFFIDGQCEAKAYMAFAPLPNNSVAVVAYNVYAKIKLDEPSLQRLENEGIPTHLTDKLRATGIKAVKDNDTFISLLNEKLGRDKAIRTYVNKIYKLLTLWAEQEVVKGQISTSLYENAGEMIQPYPGKWKLPTEGIVCYDWYKQKATKLESSYDFTIAPFDDQFYHLVPIKDGWGIIGDASKYLSPCGYTMVSCTDDKVELSMPEGGALVVYCTHSKITSNAGVVTSLGGGLWQINIPKSNSQVIIIEK